MGDWPDGLLGELATALRPNNALLTLGASGCGKSTLTRDLAIRIAGSGRSVAIVAADPGQPAWGPPSCVSLVDATIRHGDPAFDTLALACVGSLDPVRHQGSFLVSLLQLLRRVPEGYLRLLDAPGVIRGSIALEFALALIETARPDVVVAFDDNADVKRLIAGFKGRADLAVVPVRTPAAARRPGRNAAKRKRTESWDRYLDGAGVLDLDDSRLVIRRPPPEGAARSGRLVGLLDDRGSTVAMGEVIEAARDPRSDSPDPDRTGLSVRTPLRNASRVHSLLFTNAGRRADGQVVTLGRPKSSPPRTPSAWEFPARLDVPIPIGWPSRGGRAPYEPRLLNSATGDPALMLRQRRTGRALLFDLGWLEPVPTRVLHAVTDLFVSHAHMDHLQGLVTLLRVMLGPGGTVRVFGPPGLDAKLASLLGTFDLDLLGDGGPVFVVHTLHDDEVAVTRIRCDTPPVVEKRETREAPDGLLVDEEGLRVHAVQLTHSVPVLAYRCEVWRDDQTLHPRARPAHRYCLAYVADAADTDDNRRRIVALARGADLLVCEARFTETHRDRAEKTGHLTARAGAELAREANVARLVPFHFSPRYENDLSSIYREVLAVFDRVVPAVTLDHRTRLETPEA